LKNASGKWSRVRAVFSNDDVLRTVSKVPVGGDKGESRVRKTKCRRESF